MTFHVLTTDHNTSESGCMKEGQLVEKKVYQMGGWMDCKMDGWVGVLGFRGVVLES